MSDSTASSVVRAGAMVGGKYRLDALVGEGGMGSVWSATHVGLNQAVAIKFVSKEFVRSAEALRRFDAEAKAAAALKSRHVVQVFDTGTLDDGTPYIAMELLHGESLQTRVHRGGPIQIGEAVVILSQCAKALGRAHAAGIIHRDIKPDNIFLTQSTDDDSLLVKILDFGVAKMGGHGAEQGAQGATRTGAVLGTPLYMSPEQARGLKTLDQRTDLYSLGLVAYTMFTGNLAFSSESFGDLLLQICTAPLPQLCAGAPWLPSTMEAWFAKACAREPQDRYGSAQEFADALRTAAGVTMQSPVGSHPGIVEPSSPGVPAASFHVFAQSGTSGGVSRTGSGQVPVPGKRQIGIAIAAVGVLLGGAVIAAFVAFGKGGGAADRAGTSGSSATSISAAGAATSATGTAGGTHGGLAQSATGAATTTGPATESASPVRLPPIDPGAPSSGAATEAAGSETGAKSATSTHAGAATPQAVHAPAVREAPRAPSPPAPGPARVAPPRSAGTTVDLGY